MKTIKKASIGLCLFLTFAFVTVGMASAGTKPVADFTYTVERTSNTSVFNVQFTDTSTGQPTQWFWNFGDDTYSTAQNPTHEYISAGDYTVTLNARNSWGIGWTSKILHLV